MHSAIDDGLGAPLRKIVNPIEVIRISDLKLEINENSKKARWGRYCLFAATGALPDCRLGTADGRPG